MAIENTIKDVLETRAYLSFLPILDEVLLAQLLHLSDLQKQALVLVAFLVW